MELSGSWGNKEWAAEVEEGGDGVLVEFHRFTWEGEGGEVKGLTLGCFYLKRGKYYFREVGW